MVQNVHLLLIMYLNYLLIRVLLSKNSSSQRKAMRLLFEGEAKLPMASRRWATFCTMNM